MDDTVPMAMGLFWGATIVMALLVGFVFKVEDLDDALKIIPLWLMLIISYVALVHFW
jgi:hypothetical protein